jgi:tetratricopeptide (TPR) repeat protein
MNSVRALIATAWEARREGRHAEGERDLQQAITEARESGSRVDLVHALKALAHVWRDMDRSEHALSLYEEAVALSREADDGLLLAHTVRHLGDLHRETGRTADAAHCYREALSLYGAAADPPPLDVANTLRPAAILKEAEGDTEAAQQFWTEARRLYQLAGVPQGVRECERRLGLR